jgi:hypothetical protein
MEASVLCFFLEPRYEMGLTEVARHRRGGGGGAARGCSAVKMADGGRQRLQ